MTDMTPVPNWLLVVLILLSVYGAAIIAFLLYITLAEVAAQAKAVRERHQRDAALVEMLQPLLDYAQEIEERETTQ